MDSLVKSLYLPPRDSRKGDNGRLLVAGGSREYHGAYLIGAVKRIPEAIVVYDYQGPAIRGIDCVLFGIGLGDAIPKLPATGKLEAGGWKLVIDGDGLKRVKGKIPEGATLTPHENEFKMLFGCEGSERNVLEMAKKHKCVILKKGPTDIIADGRPGAGCGRVEINRVHNPGMTRGGTGDVLAGLVAALACKNDAFVAAVAGARINGNAGNMLMKRYGYNYSAGDLAEALAESLEALRR
jgi:hydroxyethylthiazole kinase-like uncharacterized protein yjeF